MDSGSTNHIAAQPGTLRSLFNKNSFSSVKVGNGSSALVTHTGHKTLPSTSRPLHLHNVLFYPDIIKNLISVRRFVTDNLCSIEFDPFGFCVKDLQTKTRLLRCDSSGPLYSISPPTSSPQALTISASHGSLWHRRLGHPRISTLTSLASFGFISLNKTDMTNLCHVCQLGKHVCMPFFNSKTSITNPFELVHSDLWTSPVSSIGDIKYYLFFLDDYSHYVWVEKE